MNDIVSVQDIAEAVNAVFFYRGTADHVRWVVSSGLMSDILTTEKEEILLLSSLTTVQVVRTADMVGAKAILITCGKPMTEDTIELAKELNITLMRTDYPVFETCYIIGKLFYEG